MNSWHLTTEDAEWIAKSLLVLFDNRVPNDIIGLDLSNNKIGSKGVEAIANAIPVSSIEDLCLDGIRGWWDQAACNLVTLD